MESIYDTDAMLTNLSFVNLDWYMFKIGVVNSCWNSKFLKITFNESNNNDIKCHYIFQSSLKLSIKGISVDCIEINILSFHFSWLDVNNT